MQIQMLMRKISPRHDEIDYGYVVIPSEPRQVYPIVQMYVSIRLHCHLLCVKCCDSDVLRMTEEGTETHYLRDLIGLAWYAPCRRCDQSFVMSVIIYILSSFVTYTDTSTM